MGSSYKTKDSAVIACGQKWVLRRETTDDGISGPLENIQWSAVRAKRMSLGRSTRHQKPRYLGNACSWVSSSISTVQMLNESDGLDRLAVQHGHILCTPLLAGPKVVYLGGC